MQILIIENISGGYFENSGGETIQPPSAGRD